MSSSKATGRCSIPSAPGRRCIGRCRTSIVEQAARLIVWAGNVDRLAIIGLRRVAGIVVILRLLLRVWVLLLLRVVLLLLLRIILLLLVGPRIIDTPAAGRRRIARAGVAAVGRIDVTVVGPNLRLRRGLAGEAPPGGRGRG